MKRLLKTLLLAAAGIVLLVVLSAAALLVFIDPNDFRDDISAQVERATGRELTIEGDLSVRLFPWLALEVGPTRLGNAAGFGDEPFLTFERARLSVRVMPLILRRDIAVGTASLASPQLNLAVNTDGVTNWDDLAADDAAAADDTAAGAAGPTGLDIASIRVSDATIRYRDAQAGSTYRLERAAIETGRIAPGEPFALEAEFDFDAMPQELAGHVAFNGRITLDEAFAVLTLDELAIEGTVRGIATEPAAIRVTSPRLQADLDAGRLAAPAGIDITALGVGANLTVRALAWADAVTADATLGVDGFALPELLRLLDIEAPPTADPDALQRVAFSADASLDADTLMLRELTLTLDDTTLRGELLLPLGAAPVNFELAADRIDLDRYMAPASDSPQEAGDGGADDFEIPVELIRSIEARGNLRLAEAQLSGMTFTGMELGLDAADDRVRLNPLSAELFDGSYSGDIRIDASGAVPTLALNERVSEVSLTPLARAMFGRDDISGTINGSFVLNARGATLAAMRENLNGNMSFELADGAWQGVDLWHQLRTARALYRRETPPAPRRPARTEFTSVLVTGTVTDGVFRNDDLIAEMPFLQIRGDGTVDLVAGEVDYALQARVLERPEFLAGATDEELAEFTEALIPVKVTGPLTDPSVRPDIEAMFRAEVEGAVEKKTDELKKRLLDRLLPGETSPEAGAADEEETPAEEDEPAEEQDIEQQLKERLKKLLEQ